MEHYDAVVVGGGFYGAAIATHLKRSGRMERVALLEQDSALLTRASTHNQARIHNGYHYPRSAVTAYRSRINLPRFVSDYPSTVARHARAVYAIARQHSKVTPRQFERFCEAIGAPLSPAPADVREWFDPRLIAAAYVVEEPVFDARALASCCEAQLRQAGVALHFNHRVTAVTPGATQHHDLAVEMAGDRRTMRATWVINATYAGLNQILPAGTAPAPLKHELAEMAVVEPPAELGGASVTVMDGPFFSLMANPLTGKHTLSHVRYTPHRAWPDAPGVSPYAALDAPGFTSRADRMIRDAARYLPSLAACRHTASMVEVKTLLPRNENDDGRPILFIEPMPRVISVLGSKLDNVYDALESIDARLAA